MPSRLTQPAPQPGLSRDNPRRLARPGSSSSPLSATPTLTAETAERTLAAAYRRLAGRGDRVTVVVERVRLLPPHVGRTGVDVPPRCRRATVYPARVRYTVRHGAPSPDGHAGDAVVIDATYRFWRDDEGRWSFTGPLSP